MPKKEEPPKVQAPTLDSWPEAPSGAYYTMVVSEYELVLLPKERRLVVIHPQDLFRPKFLWARPMRDVFITEYKIGNMSQMLGYGALATSVFRRFVPWGTVTCNIGNIISIQFENLHSFRSYTPEVAILGLAKIPPIDAFARSSWNP